MTDTRTDGPDNYGWEYKFPPHNYPFPGGLMAKAKGASNPKFRENAARMKSKQPLKTKGNKPNKRARGQRGR